MIKFFRKIRRKLLSENKFSKYLLYAIGEIILVVIGILIALQINNWNEYRKEKKLEVQILEDLKVEFAENKKDAERIISVHKVIAIAMDDLQANILQANYNKAVLDSLIDKLLYMPYYTPKPGASENLINSGNLNILSNEKLRNQLTLWSGVVDELHDDEDDGLHYTRNFIIPFLTNNYPVINLEYSYFNTNSSKKRLKDLGLDDTFGQSVEYKFVDIKSIYSNLIFQNHISFKKQFAINGVSECKPVVEAADTIVTLIDADLKRLKDD